jgi:putative endonuclease
MRLADFISSQNVVMQPKIQDFWRAYLLECKDGSLYAGVTNDVPRRVATHNAGKGAKYTRCRLPVLLVWRSVKLDKSAAHRLEARIKRLPRAKKMLLCGPASSLRRLLVQELLAAVRGSKA